MTAHALILSPRIWANLPALSDAQGVNDFGGEVAVDYQYRRYERGAPSTTRADNAQVAFLTISTRVSLAGGTSAFHQTIGRSSSSLLPYVSPALNLNFQNGVRVGASYFYPFGALREHENLRFSITVAPTRRIEESGAS